MTDSLDQQPTQTPWHRFLGKALELSVGLEHVLVESELQVSSEPPRIDILLLRRQTEEWTSAQRAMLPDEIRDSSAKHILLEFKYSESLTQGAIVQAASYEHFYRTTRKLKSEEVQMFVLCAKTPQPKRLAAFEYEPTDVSGVYSSRNIYVTHIPILVLNQLRDEPHNALVKAFASRQREKAKAFSLLRQFWKLSSELLTMLEVLQAIWSLPKGARMNEILTPERVMEIGEEWKQIFLENLSAEDLRNVSEEWKQTVLKNLPAEDLDTYINPEYKQNVLKQGREEGREEGEIAMCRTIEQILQRRFDAVPTHIQTLLTQCNLAELNELVNPAFDATDLDTFLIHLRLIKS